jgi:hypothetical protein
MFASITITIVYVNEISNKDGGGQSSTLFEIVIINPDNLQILWISKYYDKLSNILRDDCINILTEILLHESCLTKTRHNLYFRSYENLL